jgi:hypothetical protein
MYHHSKRTICVICERRRIYVYSLALPRTQASLCKKQWCAYDEFTWSIVVGRDGEGVDGKSALEMRDAWQFLVDFLQLCTISCKLWYFVVVYDFFLLIFVELTNVNILLSSGREFMLLFLVYMTYALFKVHGNSNINMSTTEALKN